MTGLSLQKTFTQLLHNFYIHWQNKNPMALQMITQCEWFMNTLLKACQFFASIMCALLILMNNQTTKEQKLDSIEPWLLLNNNVEVSTDLDFKCWEGSGWRVAFCGNTNTIDCCWIIAMLKLYFKCREGRGWRVVFWLAITITMLNNNNNVE